jgi:subtilisin family serine protease
MRVIFFHFFRARRHSTKVHAMRARLLTLLLLGVQVAAAQVGLPAVRLPGLPAVSTPGLPGANAPGLPATAPLPDVLGSAAALGGELDSGQLRELRQLRIRELLRRHRDVLETDPNGALIVRGEVLVLSPDAAALQAAAAAGFTVVRVRTLGELGLHILVLQAPGRTAHALKQLQRLDPAGTYDFNHVYLESGALSQGAPPPAAAAQGTPAVTASAAPAASAGARVGLIDSGVDVAHEVFHGLSIHAHGCGGAAIPAAHGTAVASLLVGRAAAFHGAAPGGELYAADVFCGAPTGGATDLVADAFAWLVGARVPVINVSLVGPPNRMLATVVESVLARGYLVVAAVGNDGPAAAPLYPAAWPGVIGVTAVDGRGRVLPEAERGPQVRFAAPGADMAAARSPRGYALVRGTSFASPIVAGLLALGLREPGEPAAGQALAELARRAVAHGAAGRDPAYGAGIVGADLRPPATLARTD